MGFAGWLENIAALGGSPVVFEILPFAFDDVAVDWGYSGQTDPVDGVYRLQICKVSTPWNAVDGFTSSRSASGNIVVNHVIRADDPWGSLTAGTRSSFFFVGIES